MKTINTLFLLIAMLFSSSSLFAHDFYVDGIYYNITSSTEMTVEVTCKDHYANNSYDEYTGRVSIPRIVKRGDTMYRVTSIGQYAFYRCWGLTSVEIPNSVTSIGESAFRDCSGLTSVEIPNSVTSIGGFAFYGCSGLTSITIPNCVTSIDYSAFRDCSGLTSIVVDEGNSVYDSRNNCNAIIETSTNELVLGCKTTIIPNSVTSIGWSAFYDCSGLTSVRIPNSVTSIGGVAFYGCSGLTSIEIPNSVTSIGESAFYGCSGLTSVTIPNSVTSIDECAFYGCSGLTSVTIPNSVTSIDERAFYGCSGLTSITIPNSVKSICDSTFYKCSGLTSVVIGNSVTSIGESAFESCSGLTSITIGSGVESIDKKAFAGCNNLEKVYAMSSKAVKCNQNIFSTTAYENAALYVPEGSMSSYENTAPWWFFYNISPIPTAIEDVEMDAEDSNAPVYNLQGMKMQDAENLPKGIYVKNGKKFVVK